MGRAQAVLVGLAVVPALALDAISRGGSPVLRLIARGLSNAEITAHLFIGAATVKTHINNLFAKIRVRDRAQAVAYAYRNGVADPGDG